MMKFSLRGRSLGAMIDDENYAGAPYSMLQAGTRDSFSFSYTLYNGDRVGTSDSVLLKTAALNNARFAAGGSRGNERNAHVPVDVPSSDSPDSGTAGISNPAPDISPNVSDNDQDVDDSSDIADSTDSTTPPIGTIGAVHDEPAIADGNDTSTGDAALDDNAVVDGLPSSGEEDQHTGTGLPADTAGVDGADTGTNPDPPSTSTPEADLAGDDGAPTAADDSATVTAPANAIEAATGPARGFWLEHLAPITTNDSYTSTQNTSLVVNAGSGVLANDYDPEGGALTVAQYDTSSARGGSITMNPDGSFTYTPGPNFSGADSFSYAASDGTHESLETVATFVYGPQPVQFESILENTPENTWVRVNLNQFQNVWVPREAINDNGNPSSIIAAWSSAAWDANRNEYIFWGGGHANYG
jgi:hypothetical protein